MRWPLSQPALRKTPQVVTRSHSPPGRLRQAQAIALSDVGKTFADRTCALDGISFDVSAGDFVALVGPSGCGKSTLLRLIAGLDQPTAGSITMAAGKTRMAFVFQDAHLLPWRSVIGNVALPMELRGQKRADRMGKAHQAIVAVGLDEFSRFYPSQLSGGMRMRVSLARALVTDPQVLLLDEPFAALDEITRQDLDDQLAGLWQQNRMTILFVTHSITEAAYLARRAIVLSERPARIVLDHRLELPDRRSSPLRTEPGFAAQCRLISDALAKGHP